MIYHEIGFVDAVPYHTSSTNILRNFLDNDLENICNFLNLLLKNYFHGNPIFKVLGLCNNLGQ